MIPQFQTIVDGDKGQYDVGPKKFPFSLLSKILEKQGVSRAKSNHSLTVKKIGGVKTEKAYLMI